ncbi:MAG: hypothetical protein WBF79_05390 [Rhodococcus sp. (in: high G+C Gram-positive bacteria)]
MPHRVQLNAAVVGALDETTRVDDQGAMAVVERTATLDARCR